MYMSSGVRLQKIMYYVYALNPVVFCMDQAKQTYIANYMKCKTIFELRQPNYVSV